MIRQAISPRLAISTLSNIGIRQTPLPRKLPEGGVKGKAGFGRATRLEWTDAPPQLMVWVAVTGAIIDPALFDSLTNTAVCMNVAT